MQAYQWTAALMGLSVGATILWLVRRAHLHGSYAVWWIVVAAGVVLAGLFPRVVDHIGGMLGVAYPPVLAMVVALGALRLKVLTMDLERTRQETALRRLTQRLAILEAELARLQPGVLEPASEAPGPEALLDPVEAAPPPELAQRLIA